MSIKVALHHLTEYKFEKPVTLFPHTIRLRPAVHTRTPIISYSLRVQPSEHFLNWQQDPFGNFQARYVFHEPAKFLKVEVDLVADLVVINPFDFFLESKNEHYPFGYDDLTRHELLPYLKIEDSSERVLNYVKKISNERKRTVDFLVEVNQMVQNEIGYIIRMEPGVQTPEETLKSGMGSCRDSAWLLVQIFRHLGIAARFVSGYLIQLVPDQVALDGPSGTKVDFTDLHAWTEVFLPGAGWVGLDPTSGLFAGEGHIPLACTPEPSGAAPISGATGKVDVEFAFDMKITRLDEKSRTTKPYTDEQWGRILDLGYQIDRDLNAQDVRLTMGGEPTFVSIDDMDGDEWNVDALGPTKKKYSLDLFMRLKKRFSTGALIHHGQGKWYPGESLPRWALSCYWRKDHVPIWRNPALFGDETQPMGYGELDAYRFIKKLTSYLDVTDRYILPGFEDVYYYLWKEGTLPVNVDPFKKNLKDSEERKNLRKVLEKGLDRVVGFGLPLEFDPTHKKWKTGPRSFRRERMYLVPGDSPMGYRLPLASLPHSDSLPYTEEPSSFEPRNTPLNDYYNKIYSRKQTFIPGARRNITADDWELIQKNGYPVYDIDEIVSPDSVIRMTLCLEPRDGNLYVFIPPQVRLDEYLELISAIELTAEELRMKIIVEGYLPPWDPRIEKFQITPDPGVIEVNVHPAKNWTELVSNTEILYEEARLSRLSTEKFMVDGRHTGTGGGNHITLGAEYPSDSPFLRRPDLLKSLLGYWQNHPSLSYLFSGMFIGPTSQAPRVDEARNDSLNELEIAFHHIQKGKYLPLWMVDRLFRNLLTDLTGNTHRAEFCIDKMYSPEGATGRLGLLEMRGFEMPPHAKMSITQTLLIRGLVSAFWKNPYQKRLVRYNTELHDKFMLPHYIWQDFIDVIDDLQSFGYEFEKEWYEVFLDFRFPFIGKVNIRDYEIELRTGIEPWIVLGEESTSIGTARYVDSSVERLQVKVSGLTDTRHVLICNGRMIPLHNSGIMGEYVAGIRFKAWSPYSSLHPHIAPHNPLVFEIIDTWKNRSIGGCTYYVSHPGGLSYNTFPVNGNEAESRRISRFFPFGHTPGVLQDEIREEVNPLFPYTLDLRR
ncbi:MAG: transglutaminase family protein [Leptospiraceae bacterium]|nr:transglutaminase family protein [Leptospiraceae bacterium]